MDEVVSVEPERTTVGFVLVSLVFSWLDTIIVDHSESLEKWRLYSQNRQFYVGFPRLCPEKNNF